MKLNFRAPLSTVLAILFGGLLLLAYIFDLGVIRGFILDWVIVVSAAALLLGVANLLLVHIEKARNQQNRLYSLVLVVSLILTFLVTLWQGPQGQLSLWLFRYIQVPVEANLAAVMTITLAYAAVRLLYRRPDLNAIVFVLFAVLTILGSVPLLGFNIPLLSDSLHGFNQLLASAGARGILLGVALGTVATGLRILMGADRPYGG